MHARLLPSDVDSIDDDENDEDQEELRRDRGLQTANKQERLAQCWSNEEW